MMKAFNALQLTTLFAVAPFIIGWLHGGPFPYADSAVFWIVICAYVCGFIGMCVAVHDDL